MYIYSLISKLIQYKIDAYLPREKLLKKKKKQFRKFVHFIQKRSPYYARIIKENNIDIKKCMPSDFPILTKKDVIENFDEIITTTDVNKKIIEDFLAKSKDPAELLNGKYHVIHTSGSSGQIGYYVYTKDEFVTSTINSFRISPSMLGQRMAFIALVDGHFASSSMIFATQNSILKHFFKLRAFDISKTSFDDIIKDLNEFKPHFINGYATAIKLLAEAKLRGELDVSPKTIACGGEPLLAKDEDLIEKAFGLEIFNVYGCSEHLLMGAGKKSFGGMYMFEDDLEFEFQDNGLLVTNTFNRTLPLIRYQMSDIVKTVDDTDHIYPFTKVDNLVGRQEYAPEFINDSGILDFIHPLILVELYVKNLNCFQIRYVDKQAFIFKACLEKDLDDTEREKVISAIKREVDTILANKKMTNVSYKIEEVDKIDVDPKTSKYKLIIKE